MSSPAGPLKMLTKTLTIALMLAASTAAVAAQTPDKPPTLEQWKAKRVANLTSETGWLTLVGLYWLKNGDNGFGRDKSNRIVLDHPGLAAKSGSFDVKDGTVTFVTAPGAVVTHNGKPVTTIAMTPDSKGDPTLLAAGSLRFFVIERVGKLGIRVRDVEHPARKHFAGLEYFPTREDWIVDARFVPYPAGKRIPILNILGMTEQMVSPGAIVFNKDGREWKLDTILEAPGDKELFLMFADQTSARETYGAGRFMYIPMPQDGHVKIDFNRSYNPPCAFNEFATCPLPPSQNRMQTRVEAGEKKYAAGH
jgi:uncharacterized protein